VSLFLVVHDVKQALLSKASDSFLLDVTILQFFIKDDLNTSSTLMVLLILALQLHPSHLAYLSWITSLLLLLERANCFDLCSFL
jgi:hypothetical protein